MKECCKQYLDEQFGGDADTVAEIYKEYVTSVGAKLSEADSALAAGEWDAIDKIAHAIKGNSLTAGDNEMASIAIDLRNAAKLQDGGHASELISRLKELFATL